MFLNGLQAESLAKFLMKRLILNFIVWLPSINVLTIARGNENMEQFILQSAGLIFHMKLVNMES